MSHCPRCGFSSLSKLLCRERQNWFALKERAVYPGHQGQHLQISAEEWGTDHGFLWGHFFSNESKIISNTLSWLTFLQALVYFSALLYNAECSLKVQKEMLTWFQFILHIFPILGPGKHCKLSPGCPWPWKLLFGLWDHESPWQCFLFGLFFTFILEERIQI